ncbi:RNA polymerase sigma factor [Nocardioides mesophilus]|uniref:Sigma-70 family RNA polymerase sigma factor n=1 Tax=Nocardioides mesophilus TaxID=433659 RepID=A0A7G9RET2_9ACTN|nr:sigma-70 family RNA polymerase sigma factor [Nocardioides mesophilus]QNN54107.1 sigma-70 family RNA polymerase sigma factor [Nocardioides mesophilus]
MSDPSRAPDPEHTFTTLYEAVYGDLVRFVQRRTHAPCAEDVVADALMVVWRRLDEVPEAPEDARAWIFGITRNILLNEQRGERRGRALRVRLADTATGSLADPEAEGVVSRVDLTRAWLLLSAVHQEALTLAVFEGLRAPQAAAVLGISPVAFRLRVSRARRALRLHLHHQPQAVGLCADAPERSLRS